MTRSKQQREQDRADLLAVLEDATERLSTRRVAQLVYGGDVTAAWRHEAQVLTDLNALARAGKAIKSTPTGWYSAFWERATPEAIDALDDAADVRRQMAAWDPTDEGTAS